MKLTIDQAAWAAGAQVAVKGGPFAGVFTDTRKPVAKGLFVARKGENFDGSDFVEQAVKGGATGVLVTPQALAKVSQGIAALTAADTGRALAGIAAAWRHRFPDLRVV